MDDHPRQEQLDLTASDTAAARHETAPSEPVQPGLFPDDSIPDEQEDEVERFREFLDNVSPEDFASGG